MRDGANAQNDAHRRELPVHEARWSGNYSTFRPYQRRPRHLLPLMLVLGVL